MLATGKTDGRSEYVLEADKEEFERRGAAPLGEKEALSKIKPSEAEQAARSTALAQLDEQREQKRHVQGSAVVATSVAAENP